MNTNPWRTIFMLIPIKDSRGKVDDFRLTEAKRNHDYQFQYSIKFEQIKDS